MSRSIQRGVCCGLVFGAWASAALAVPDYWDVRLNAVCGLELIDVAAQVPAGHGYWRLIDGRFEDETESNKNHNIYIKCLQEDGTPIYNQKIFTAWPYGFTAVDESQCKNDDHWACDYTKPAVDDYWGNMPMWYRGCPANNCDWDYTAFVSEQSSPVEGLIGLSDKVIGMGLHNPFGTPCNAHVNFRFIYKWTIAGPPPLPTISRSPASFTHTISQGQNLADDTFTVWNSGGSTLSYSVADDITGPGDWLSETPISGTATTETDTITIHYVTSGLAVGNYPATITISDPNSTNKTATISISLTVGPPVIPGDFDGDGDVDQIDFGRFQACYTGSGLEQTDATCEKAKLDGDIDVDQQDFDLFARCMTGAGVQGDPNCAQGG